MTTLNLYSETLPLTCILKMPKPSGDTAIQILDNELRPEFTLRITESELELSLLLSALQLKMLKTFCEDGSPLTLELSTGTDELKMHFKLPELSRMLLATDASTLIDLRVYLIRLSWVPQSTVALVIAKSLIELDRGKEQGEHNVECLLQVHDSNVTQWPKAETTRSLLTIKKAMEVEVPYDDPLVMPVDAAISEVSWGDVEEVEWPIAA